MKRDFNTWLASLGAGGAGEVADRAARLEHRAHERRARSSTGSRNSTSPTRWTSKADRARYEADRAKDIALAGTHGIDEVMKAQRLDALLFPGASGAAIAAKPGYPTVIVPFGMVPNAPTPPFPDGLRREAGAVRRQLHRHGVQRAAADRAGVRVRAGHKAGSAAHDSVVPGSVERNLGTLATRYLV